MGWLSRSWDYLRRRLHAAPARAASPEPKRRSIEGSGTTRITCGGGGGSDRGVASPIRGPLKPLLPSSPVPTQPMEMVLWSMVTAPVLAKALPQPIIAPVFSVMLVSATIFPTNDVVVSRVAELPTFQYS